MVSQTHGLISTGRPLFSGPSAAGGEQAFLATREQLVESVLKRIRSPDRIGAVLLGDEGSGKTAILRTVAHRASQTHHVVRIWASKRASSEPYRAIAFLLAELETEQTGHPLTILQGIRALLEEQSNGRPIVLAIDNAACLDHESAMIISRLVMAGVASVLIASKALRLMDDCFADLWREGDLERFDLPCLTRTQIRAIAEAALDAPVSWEAVEVLWRSSEGNARYLYAALEELSMSGLRVQEGTWVAASGQSLVPSPVHAKARSTLGALQDQELQIVRALAYAGSLPAGAVRHLAGLTRDLSGAPVTTAAGPGASARSGEAAAHLDALQSLIVLGNSGGVTTVSLASGLFAAAVREQTTTDEAAALYTLLAGQPTDAFDPAGLDPMMHAEWLLAAGFPVPEDLTLAAARRCIFLGLDDRAHFWIDLHPDDQDLERILEAAHAALAVGHGGEAEALLAKGHALVAADSAPIPAAVRLLILRCRALRLVGSAPAQRTALLDDAERRIALAERQPGAARGLVPQQFLEHRADVTLTRAEDGSFGGNYQMVAKLLQGADRTGWTQDQEALGDGLLCEALAMTDQQLAADGLARSMGAGLGSPSISREVRDATRLRIAVALDAGGTAGGPVSDAGQDIGTHPSSVTRDSIEDIIAGVREALKGRPDQARALLLPVAQQLVLKDAYCLLPLVTAALASTPADTDAAGAVIGYFPQAAAQSTPWTVNALIGHLRSASPGVRESRMETAAKFADLADAAHAQGAPMLEMMHRLAQLRAGDTGAARALAAAAAGIEGVYAAACELYGRAADTGDAELFAQAMESAQLAGDSGLARDCAAQALQAAQLSDARGVLRDVQRRAGRLFGDTTDLQMGVALERLTKREREVAQLVARGENNKSIAVTMGVTARTVEGHLYQIFSKLHLRTRGELVDLILVGVR
ncbi:DNA-binding CsgD family transcriptional regulator [Arthrobacter sp. PL16]|uniref:helix-turn-helix transcriptional regulator n=1 Tax=Arthrobacter sp. PL16 TaxID=3071720 RepID=UPI002E0473EA|nr:DNA-binding CsgD family transcriptional regulator [Arthrobacter sp. PL16]